MNENEEELKARLERMASIEKALSECYDEMEAKSESLPDLRSSFPEKLKKMTADLQLLDPELQEKINKGDIAFFTDNPDRAKDAAGVLLQLQELNALLQEIAGVPRLLDRLNSTGKELRASLETEWGYFNTHRRQIKQDFPDFPFPSQPKQLLRRPPSPEVPPPQQMGPSSLVGKRFTVVKTPPIQKS